MQHDNTLISGVLVEAASEDKTVSYIGDYFGLGRIGKCCFLFGLLFSFLIGLFHALLETPINIGTRPRGFVGVCMETQTQKIGDICCSWDGCTGTQKVGDICCTWGFKQYRNDVHL